MIAMKNFELKYCFFTVLAVAFLSIVGLAFLSKVNERREAQLALEKATLTQLEAESAVEIKDYYGTNFKFDKTATDDCMTVVGISAGPDHIFGNEDDISCTKRNYNNSRIVGKWVSKKSKEFFKGVISGIAE